MALAAVEMTPSIAYIYDHLDDQISVETLAGIENYNVTYYNEWFKNRTGTTPNSYVRNLRINKAKNMLEETDLPIIDIAFSVGYSSNAAFTRAFRNHTGITPFEYKTNGLRYHG